MAEKIINWTEIHIWKRWSNKLKSNNKTAAGYEQRNNKTSKIAGEKNNVVKLVY